MIFHHIASDLKINKEEMGVKWVPHLPLGGSPERRPGHQLVRRSATHDVGCGRERKSERRNIVEKTISTGFLIFFYFIFPFHFRNLRRSLG